MSHDTRSRAWLLSNLLRALRAAEAREAALSHTMMIGVGAGAEAWALIPASLWADIVELRRAYDAAPSDA